MILFRECHGAHFLTQLHYTIPLLTVLFLFWRIAVDCQIEQVIIVNLAALRYL